jgi:hypothetical protein
MSISNEDTIDIVNVINHLLEKYNKPYDIREDIPKYNNNISNYDNNLLNFKNIIMELNNVEKKCIKLDKNKINKLFNPSISVKNIYEMSFVDDLDLLESIIEYRKLVIRHIILIINYNIECYKCLLVDILHLSYLKSTGLDVKDTDIQKLNELKEERKFYVVSIINKSAKYYEETLCKYIEINNKLQFIKSTIKSNIISI